MPVKKSDLVGHFTHDQEVQLKDLIEVIDRKLTIDYISGNKVTIDLTSWPHEKIQREIIRLYTEAGWEVEFVDDQRDGNWIELK